MLTYRKPVECSGFDAIIVVREDGELEIDGYDIEYEIAYAAMGGKGESVCKKLVEKWSESKTAAICELLVEDPVVPLSLAADVVSRAYMMFKQSNQAACRQPPDEEHYIMDAVSFARNLVELKTNPPPLHSDFWVTYNSLEEDTKIYTIAGKCFAQNSFEARKRRGQYGWEAKHINIFDAAGYLSRAASKSVHEPHFTATRDQEVGYYSALAITEACWTIAFSTGEGYTRKDLLARFDDAKNWTVARFVHQMNRFEATGEWK
jgi:hypothetical protein